MAAFGPIRLARISRGLTWSCGPGVAPSRPRQLYRERVRPTSNHGVSPRGLAEPLRAQLWRPLQRLEVDVDQPEPVGEAVHPFEVVLRAPVEVPVHGHALPRHPMELSEAGAEEHHPD